MAVIESDLDSISRRASTALPSRWLGLAGLLAFVAASLSGYLAWVASTSGNVLAGCGGDATFDCDQVLASRWSHGFGVPVSVPAIFVYAGTLIALLGVSRRAGANTRRVAWRFLLLAAPLAAVGGLWFLGLQAFVLHKFCLYCDTIHLCGLCLAAIVYRQAPWRSGSPAVSANADQEPNSHGPREHGTRETISPSTAWSLCGAAISGLVVFAGTQIWFPKNTAAVSISPGALVEGGQSPADASGPQSAARPASNIGGKRPAGVTNSIATQGAVPKTSGANSSPPSGDEDAPAMMADGDATASDTTASDTTPGDTTAGDDDEDFGKALEAIVHVDSAAIASAHEKKPHVVAPIELAEPLAPEESRRPLFLMDHAIEMDVYAEPIWGSPDAKTVAVEVFDYTCPHCHHMHALMEQARERYGDDMVVVLAPTPMNPDCNRYMKSRNPKHELACQYAQLALAVWEVDPAHFLDFHLWLMAPHEGPPDLRSAEAKAERLIGVEELAAAQTKSSIGRRISRNCRLYMLAGTGALPKLFLGGTVVSGEPANAQALFTILENRSPLRPAPIKP